MAPITDAMTSAGVSQAAAASFDDEGLSALHQALHTAASAPETTNDSSITTESKDCSALRHRLVQAVQPFLQQAASSSLPSWPFEEQVDLHLWIQPLNAIDAVIRHALEKYPRVLLIGPVPRNNNNNNSNKKDAEKSSSSAATTDPPPADWILDLVVLLRFLSLLLRHSYCKTVFHSGYELTDLLAAADDALAAAALECLYSWMTPCQWHKQAGNHFGSSGNNSGNTTAEGLGNPQEAPRVPLITLQRCVALARAWGTRAHGLGLAQVVTADAAFEWPAAPAQVVHSMVVAPMPTTAAGPSQHHHSVVTITLTAQQLLQEQTTTTAADSSSDAGIDAAMNKNASGNGVGEDEHNQHKRRRVTLEPKKPTAELFAMALEQLNQQQPEPAAAAVDPLLSGTDANDRLFSLLVDIRLARNYKTNVLPAVTMRLQALVALLHSVHTASDMVSGYFTAQPEWVCEMVELLQPTVSATHICSGPTRDAILHLSQGGQAIPWGIRVLAVEALAALVSRRDQDSTRLLAVLSELGVGKGLYMGSVGVLPTLLRYSLAAITAVTTTTTTTTAPKNDADGDVVMGEAAAQDTKNTNDNDDDDDAVGMDLGLAFLEATLGPQAPRHLQVEQALVWLDALLNLTVAVVSTPTGTTALTESGMVPALLAVVALDTHSTVRRLLRQPEHDSADNNNKWLQWLAAQVRFATAQAVQILEGMIVAQSNAAAAFSDLQGVQTLTDRVAREMHAPRASQRVLLYSLVTCLTVVFHQESSSAAASTTTASMDGSSQLRQPALTQAVIACLGHVPHYGGHLASLVATLLTDVLNHDPHVVHYVHEAGIAQAFFDMLTTASTTSQPPLPPVPELLMSIPNVLQALALTAEGAQAVQKANPFGAFLRLFHLPQYAMPASKCLLNELTAICGTGLEELMRHVQGVKPLVLQALVEALQAVVTIGRDLLVQEQQQGAVLSSSLETQRSCLIQYVLNMGQLLEQVLHNDDHVEPFCQAGGLQVLLDLYEASLPQGWQYLCLVNPLSSTAVSTLHHSTIPESITLALKCLFLKHASPKTLLEGLVQRVTAALDEVEAALTDLAAGPDDTTEKKKQVLEACLPRVHLFDASSEACRKTARALRGVQVVSWWSSVLGLALKAVGRRMDDVGLGGGPSASAAQLAEWRSFLATSTDLHATLQRLLAFHQDALGQVCGVRAKEDEEAVARPRVRTPCRYRLRIVCPEGAVVRNGIEIDSCVALGSMELAQVENGVDRCINSSGILRYQTTSGGWISEMTRGHGREPITEVLHIWKEADDDESAAKDDDDDEDKDSKRTECPLATLQELGVHLFARLQRTYGDLLTSTSRLVVQCFRTVGTRSWSTNENGEEDDDATDSPRAQLQALLDKLLYLPIVQALQQQQPLTNSAAATALYFGSLLDPILQCLFFDERRERRMVNFLLLVKLMGFDDDADTRPLLLERVATVLEFGLRECAKRSSNGSTVSPVVASCVPPVLLLLRRLVSTPMSSSPVATVMSRLKWKHLRPLLGLPSGDKENDDEFFAPESFLRRLQCQISSVVQHAWTLKAGNDDDDQSALALLPPHLIHPYLSLTGLVLKALEDVASKKSNHGSSQQQRRSTLADWIRSDQQQQQQQAAARAAAPRRFEPSPEAITRLEEMGFGRDHAEQALRATQSNRIEVAMEYALAHPPTLRSSNNNNNNNGDEAAAGASNEDEDDDDDEEAENHEDEEGGGGGGGNEEEEQEEDDDDEVEEDEGDDPEEEGDAPTAMDVDEPAAPPPQAEGEPQQPSSASGPEQQQTPPQEDKELVAALDSWMELLPKVCRQILAKKPPAVKSKNKNPLDGDAESEALTTVVTTFLLELCQRYPEKKTAMVEAVLDQLLLAATTVTTNDDDDNAVVLAKLTHAAVLILKSAPQTRVLVLQKGLVTPLVERLAAVTKDEPQQQQQAPPVWMPHVLLFLDLLAQPMVAFDKTDLLQQQDKPNDDDDETKKQWHADYWDVLRDHKTQSDEIGQAMTQAFAILGGGSTSSSKPKPTEDDTDENNKMDTDTNNNNSNGQEGEEAQQQQHTPKSIPAYFPLLPRRCVSVCLEACRRLILQQQSSSSSATATTTSPGILQACLTLLLNVLRSSPALAADGLRDGGCLVETILQLPAASRFAGNAGLVAQVLKRLLEDEATLLAAMETEMRTRVTRLAHKKNESSGTGSSSSSTTVAVSLTAFMETTTSLLARDPSAFCKAMSTTLQIEPAPGSSSSSSSREFRVTLLQSKPAKASSVPLPESPAKRTASAPVEAETTTPSKPARARRSVSSSGHRRRSKSSGGGGGPKRKQREESLSLPPPPQTPAALITSQVIDRILTTLTTTSDVDDEKEEDDGVLLFLSAAELLGILSDLVLAVPACASSVHNYRPHRKHGKHAHYKMSHAVAGAAAPPTKTFCNFLLHVVLAQDRWSWRHVDAVWKKQAAAASPKRRAARILKTCQAAARVLLALSARPGEGRRRVLHDLSFALSAGRLGGHESMITLTTTTTTTPTTTSSNGSPSAPVSSNTNNSNKQMIVQLNALHSWGELCLGLAVPRGSGQKILENVSVHYEVVRGMYEAGLVHALMLACHAVPVPAHPMASSTLSTLLLPLELLTRFGIVHHVRDVLVLKDAAAAAAGGDAKAAVPPPDDMMEVDDPAAHHHHHHHAHEEEDDPVSEEDESIEAEDEDNGEEEDEEEELSVDDEEEEDDDEDDEEESDGDEDEEEVDDEGAWNLDYEHAFGPEHAEPPPAPPAGNDDPDGGMDDNDPARALMMEDGWTRIDAPPAGGGFGGMLLAGRGGDGDRARGFIDAAEAMIGTLLRSGEINQDSLAEIEGHLGIRIMGSGGGGGAHRLRALGEADSFAARLLGGRGAAAPGRGTGTTASGTGSGVGALPQIHQRSPPDGGGGGGGGGAAFSFGAGSGAGRLAELSSMEVVFGGPSVTLGSRNYDVHATITPDETRSIMMEEPHITLLDLQLFPGGPAAAAAAANSQQQALLLHPLLSGVDLAPVNALVGDLQPHGVRARRPVPRRPDWSSSSSSSFGGYMMARGGRPPWASSVQEDPTTALQQPPQSPDSQPQQVRLALQDELTQSLVRAQQQQQQANPNNNNAQQQQQQDSPSTGSEGEGVASSLAATLRLNGDEHAEMMMMQAEMAATAAPQAPESSEAAAAAPAAEGEESSPPPQEAAAAAAAASGQDMAAAAAEPAPPPPPQDEPQAMEEPAPAPAEVPAAAEEQPEAPPPPAEEEPQAETEEGQDEGNEEGGEDEEEEDDDEDGDDDDDEDDGAPLVCPPNIEEDVFHSLPREMQRDVVNEYAQSQDLALQLDGTSLDPEVLAALPEDMRREVMEQERRERAAASAAQEAEAAPADPSRAEEMDNADFIASLAPELRAEILVTADEETLQSLPANLQAEANVLRERAAQRSEQGRSELRRAGLSRSALPVAPPPPEAAARKKVRTGKVKVEMDRETVVYLPKKKDEEQQPSSSKTVLTTPFAMTDVQLLLRLFFLLSPIRPPRLLSKLLANLTGNFELRQVFCTALLKLLHERGSDASKAIAAFGKGYSSSEEDSFWRNEMDRQFPPTDDDFPPVSLMGVAPEIPQPTAMDDFFSTPRVGTAALVAANMPKLGSNAELPSVVVARLIDTLQQLCKTSGRFCLHSLSAQLHNDETCLESMMDLIQQPRFLRSSGSLDQLLSLLETVVSPLSQLPRHNSEEQLEPITTQQVEAATAAHKEWLKVPAVVISPERLQALCWVLRQESCRESAFGKVNVILRRLCRVESNRRHVLAELASVAHELGQDAVRDLQQVGLRMNEAAAAAAATEGNNNGNSKISSSVTFSTSTSELKLLRVLQTLHSMCTDTSAADAASNNHDHHHHHHKKNDSVYVTQELVHLLRQLDFGLLWDELSSCLKTVQVLEGVATLTEGVDTDSNENETTTNNSNAASSDEAASAEDETGGNKKLRNSSAGLLTRFLPSIEAFFVATASATKPKEENGEKNKTTSSSSPTAPREIPLENIVGGSRLVQFVGDNRILLNALVRNNPALLDRGLRALVQVPRCRVVLDFDVKRQWFKTQVRRLRQHAARRHGNIRLHIHRKTVFEEAYHQLRLRNADEMRGRLHITFRDEEGIDAGGLSREFFAILAKEMFNPNYALFTSTEDGCTFQPNPNSSINPDHLSYFRFCGRIVGKAVADGYLLDAHFTRSLYKHMLGLKPSHQDMEAIDPDYYRNLKTILEYKLTDIGLDDNLHFSIDDNSFGRAKVIDLVPNGRSVVVTEENKEEYVQLVCKHRMTTAIQNQIQAYLDGFYELVSPDLICIFTPRELELVISGLPDIDVDDLKQNTDYVGWKATDPEIVWFWNVMYTLTQGQKAAFLQFVTGSSKVPLQGFAELQGMRGIQKFSIHKVAGSSTANNQTTVPLMSAHTCFNSLDLPPYRSQEELQEKLLYAITEGAGSFLFA